jgi:hypothetical protein
MPITSFKDVQKLFSNVDASGAPHGNFWQKLTYEQFINGNVPGINPPMKILVVGKPEQSVLIQAISDDDFQYGRMPLGGPYYSKQEIDDLADWIKKGCPK